MRGHTGLGIKRKYREGISRYPLWWRRARHLEIDCYDERGGNCDSKRLVVGGRLSILSHSLQVGPQGDEEEHQGCEDPVQQAHEEPLIVEEQVSLSHDVQPRKPEAQLVTHVLVGDTTVMGYPSGGQRCHRHVATCQDFLEGKHWTK